ncbi:hypothetical protein BGW80DRAFT_1321112 [Lactifluus volemus]|nr:hypothetical protein BGW80DRAFT_1321112 [Lactifluus volemus]
MWSCALPRCSSHPPLVNVLHPIPSSRCSSPINLDHTALTTNTLNPYKMSGDDDSSGWQLTESDPGVFTELLKSLGSSSRLPTPLARRRN